MFQFFFQPQIAISKFYFSANGHSVISRYSSVAILYSSTLSSCLSSCLQAKMWCVPFALFSNLSSFALSYTSLSHTFFFWLHWSHFLLSFALSPFLCLFSLISQHHRELKMSLSLSASQVQAVMLALSKLQCMCVWIEKEVRKCFWLYGGSETTLIIWH